MRLRSTVALLGLLGGAIPASASDGGLLTHYAGEGNLVTVPAGIGGGLGLLVGVPSGFMSAALCAPAYYPLRAMVPTWMRHEMGGHGAGECAWLGLLVAFEIADAGYVAFGAPFHALASPSSPARDGT
jgi:hypothetical protein